MTSLGQVAAVLFGASALPVLYTYALYPLVLHLVARVFGRPSVAPSLAERDFPPVSVLIAAYNEEAEIGRRIENALRLDYPKEKLEIVIASDGSTDRTPQIVRQFDQDGVRLVHEEARRGKAAVLGESFPRLRGEIVLLSDANTFTEPDAARRLVRWFADPGVGVVCGRLVLTDAASGKNADGAYWRYETFLKTQEGRLGALLGSNGAIYAIRKSAFVPIPPNTIVDDFVIPLLSKLRFGLRIIYDREAVAHEETAPDVASEFRRRSRIGAGGWQAIAMLWPLLNPRHGWTAFSFFSHKLLRWLCPFFLLGMLASAALGWGWAGFRILLGLQLAFYAGALLAAWLPGRGRGARLLRVANMFVVMNAALLVGFFRWLRGPKDGTWARTKRTAEGADAPELARPLSHPVRAGEAG